MEVVALAAVLIILLAVEVMVEVTLWFPREKGPTGGSAALSGITPLADVADESGTVANVSMGLRRINLEVVLDSMCTAFLPNRELVEPNSDEGALLLENVLNFAPNRENLRSFESAAVASSVTKQKNI